MNGFTFGVAMFGLFTGSAPGTVDGPTQVQRYQEKASYTRYCMDTNFDHTGPVTICMYETLTQCQGSRSRPSERCFLNPAFANEGPRRHRRGG